MRTRNTTRRSAVTTAAAVAALALTLAACGGGNGTDTPTDAPTGGETTGGEPTGTAAPTGAADFTTITEGTLTVCSEIPYPPFEFEAEDGSYTGFDIDLATAVAEELGLGVEVLNQSFEGIQSGAVLAAGTCDMAASAMTITEEREENLDFTDSYFEASQSLLVKVGGPVSTLADTSGQSIAVQAETTGAAYAEENAPDDATLVEYPSGADAISALQADQVVAVLQDLPPNTEAVGNDDTLEIAETYDTGENYGFAVAQERGDGLLEAINGALAALREDGTYDTLFEQYFPGA